MSHTRGLLAARARHPLTNRRLLIPQVCLAAKRGEGGGDNTKGGSKDSAGGGAQRAKL